MDNTLSLKVDTPIGSVNMVDDRQSSGEASEGGQTDVNISQGQSEAMQNLCGALEHALKELQKLRESIFNSHREQIAQLSVAIAEKILCKEISTENYEIEKIISKALGAAPRQIITLILAEAFLLSMLGAVIGFLLGQLGSYAIRYAFPEFPAYAPSWAVVVALLVAVITGLLFSLMPARRAARLDPVLALSRR